ncbi:MAG: hypothetical protein M3N47_07870, partial [Chloroflexota bacterium]|nr:hypothetical protein [Chloroflexota bacterium]
ASRVVTTFGTGTFFTAVPPVSDGLHSPRTLPTAADGAGGPPLKVLRDLGQPPFFGLFTRDMSHPPAQLAAELDAQATTGAGTMREHLHWDRVERARSSSTAPTRTR